MELRDWQLGASRGALSLPDAGGEGSGEPRVLAGLVVPEEDEGVEAAVQEGARFASVEAALAAGPKTFEALMAALASRDGREVVLALEALRSDGRLAREKDGRYALRPN